MDQGISSSNTPAELIVTYKLEVASVTFSYCGGSVVAYTMQPLFIVVAGTAEVIMDFMFLC